MKRPKPGSYRTKMHEHMLAIANRIISTEGLAAVQARRVAQEAGCVVTDPFGAPLDGPLDTMTNLGFAAYANKALAQQLMPIVSEEVRRLLV